MSLAEAFLEQMNEFHTFPEPYDTPLDLYLHKSYAEVLTKKRDIDWSKLYFSPSGATKDASELFAKAKRFKKDDKRWQPHQRRYMAQGTALGDWLQREIMLCERHYRKFTGKDPMFKMGLVDGKPAMEEFVFASHPVMHDGYSFNLNGTCDGILVTDTGEKVLLEIKSKQNTPAKTSLYTMKAPEEKHVKQVVCYSDMYSIDRAIIVYVNGAKEGWFAPEEKLKKTPDMRAFDVTVTDEMKDEVFGHFSNAARIIESGRMPLPDLRSWEFHEFKQSVSERLTDEQMADLERVAEVQSALEGDSFVGTNIRAAIKDIKRRRGE